MSTHPKAADPELKRIAERLANDPEALRDAEISEAQFKAGQTKTFEEVVQIFAAKRAGRSKIGAASTKEPAKAMRAHG